MVKKIKRKKRRGAQRPSGGDPQRVEIDLKELQGIIEEIKPMVSAEKHQSLSQAIDTLAILTQALEVKGASIKRLRHLIFGPSTEKTSKVLGDHDDKPGDAEDAGDADGSQTSAVEGDDNGTTPGQADGDAETKKKPKGHGRNGAGKYTGAETVKVEHESLKPGDPCPEYGCDGKVYPMSRPKTLVRVTGMAPLKATVWELEQLRCNLCGVIFTAKAPEGVGEEKYDETASSMVGLLKYGGGVPFNRLDKLQKSLGIPLPSSTQWDIVEKAAALLLPAYDELIRQAAQGELLHNDDTVARILDLMGMRRQANESDDPTERTGLFTTGIVSLSAGRRIAAFFTGRQHAGENLADVLAQRAAELAPPIQMCDALSRNTCGDFESIVANCVTHARRKFVEVAHDFPEECRYVLETLGHVYRNDALAKERGMSPEERLALHQAESRPVMDKLKTWLKQQFDDRLVEPNSSLGGAIKYMQKHWEKLTLFLTVPGAPLDNTIVERALKRVVLHRKNALFYKTTNGARVGDLFMTIIHTCELHGTNTFDYLVAVQRHTAEVERSPDRWMPWNYTETLATIQPDSS